MVFDSLIFLKVSANSKARRTLNTPWILSRGSRRNLQPDGDDDSRGIPLSIEGNTISVILSEHRYFETF